MAIFCPWWPWPWHSNPSEWGINTSSVWIWRKSILWFRRHYIHKQKVTDSIKDRTSRSSLHAVKMKSSCTYVLRDSEGSCWSRCIKRFGVVTKISTENIGPANTHALSNGINNSSDDDRYQLWDIINRDQAEPMFQLQSKLKLFWPSFTETESVYGTTETSTLSYSRTVQQRTVW